VVDDLMIRSTHVIAPDPTYDEKNPLHSVSDSSSTTSSPGRPFHMLEAFHHDSASSTTTVHVDPVHSPHGPLQDHIMSMHPDDDFETGVLDCLDDVLNIRLDDQNEDEDDDDDDDAEDEEEDEEEEEDLAFFLDAEHHSHDGTSFEELASLVDLDGLPPHHPDIITSAEQQQQQQAPTAKQKMAKSAKVAQANKKKKVSRLTIDTATAKQFATAPQFDAKGRRIPSSPKSAGSIGSVATALFHCTVTGAVVR
jgi:hypothetical protein